MSSKKTHVLKADGVTVCGLKNQTEGLRPNKAQYATCKRCIAGIMKGFKA